MPKLKQWTIDTENNNHTGKPFDFCSPEFNVFFKSTCNIFYMDEQCHESNKYVSMTLYKTARLKEPNSELSTNHSG